MKVEILNLETNKLTVYDEVDTIGNLTQFFMLHFWKNSGNERHMSFDRKKFQLWRITDSKHCH